MTEDEGHSDIYYVEPSVLFKITSNVIALVEYFLPPFPVTVILKYCIVEMHSVGYQGNVS